MTGLVDRVAQSYCDHFDSAPDGVWQAPGRANLIGEHTDYNEGFVLPFALDQGTVVAAGPADGDVLEMTSQQAGDPPVTVRLDELSSRTAPGWAAYPAGVAWALREAGYPVAGTRLAIDSDLPQGAGLSSSHALECAVALALTQLRGVNIPRPQLAVLIRRVENDFIGVPTGIMDQSASLLCQPGHALLLDCCSGERDAVPLEPAAAGLGLLLIDTRAQHLLSDSGYGDRHGECAAAAGQLGVRSLRDITDVSELAGLDDPILLRRARHVVTENKRVLEAASMLRAGNVTGVGPLLNQSHASLRDDFQISWPEADVTVEAAVGAGALGARMMGGGFGGSVIALAPADSAGVREAVLSAFASHGWSQPEFHDARPSHSARRLK